MATIRLDKLICSTFGVTRREAKKYLARGEICVNGQPVRDGTRHYQTDVSLTCAGKVGKYQEHVYIMMNKPGGVISASRDLKAKTALDLLPQDMRRRGLFVAGRLDKDTTGFLLITDDGDFAHEILSPRKHVDKTYLVTLRYAADERYAAAFAAGMKIGAEICKSAVYLPLSENSARVVLQEGKFHQIKRMFAALDNEVVALHREKMGNLPLDDGLLPGQARYLTDREIEMIRGMD